MRSLTYAIVDIETTGHSPAKGDRMIQFAVVSFVIGKYNQPIQPSYSLERKFLYSFKT